MSLKVLCILFTYILVDLLFWYSQKSVRNQWFNQWSVEKPCVEPIEPWSLGVIWIVENKSVHVTRYSLRVTSSIQTSDCNKAVVLPVPWTILRCMAWRSLRLTSKIAYRKLWKIFGLFHVYFWCRAFHST